jgi:Transposase DDE domain
MGSWIPWAIFWLRRSLRPVHRKGRRLENWLRKSSSGLKCGRATGLWRSGPTREKHRQARPPSRGIKLEVISHSRARRGFLLLLLLLLPRRWVVERSPAWSARLRRLAKDYERLPTTLAGLHFVVFACLMLSRILA